MGARAVSLFLHTAPYKNFYIIGMAYAWGRNSVSVFEAEMKRAKKNFVGSVSPIGTKHFSTYITKIRQSGADACYVTMAGDDYNAFLSQAAQYRLPENTQLLSEVVDLTVLRAMGDAALGLISSMPYCFRIDNPKNKNFVAMWEKEYGVPHDNNEGEQGRRYRSSPPGSISRRAPTPRHCAKHSKRSRLTTSTAMSRSANAITRWCRTARVVKLVKAEDFSYPVPEIIATFPGEKTFPPATK